MEIGINGYAYSIDSPVPSDSNRKRRDCENENVNRQKCLHTPFLLPFPILYTFVFIRSSNKQTKQMDGGGLMKIVVWTWT